MSKLYRKARPLILVGLELLIKLPEHAHSRVIKAFLGFPGKISVLRIRFVHTSLRNDPTRKQALTMTARITAELALYEGSLGTVLERETTTMSLANSLSCALENSMKIWQVRRCTFQCSLLQNCSRELLFTYGLQRRTPKPFQRFARSHCHHTVSGWLASRPESDTESDDSRLWLPFLFPSCSPLTAESWGTC